MKTIRLVLSNIILMMILFGCSAKAIKPSLPNATIKPGELYILFYSTRDNLPGRYLMKPDGSSVQRYNTSELNQYKIDGITWISELQLFVMGLTDASNQQDLYLVNINGAVQQRLTNSPYGKSDATYSSDAKKFAYVCVEADLDICTISSDGKNPVNLTNIPSRDFFPQWSKTGTQIIFTSNRSGVPGIWIVALDGSGMKSLSSVLVPESNPEISPDWQTIAFQSQRDINSEIYVMDTNGQNLMNLTRNSANDTEPKWSPDGNFIAFRSDRDNGNDLYVMKADGTQVVNITKTPAVYETSFVWTPDSTAIIYSASVENNFDIFSVSRDGETKLNLTNSPAEDTDPQMIDLK